MTSKVWEVMNDLEMVTSKIVSAREIIDAAIDRIQEHQYDKAETMMSASYEFLEYYLNEFDTKFKLAWQETVKKQKQEEDDAWDAVNREKDYYEPSSKCEGAWNSFWEENYYPEEYGLQYTDEEITAMCDAAEKKDKVKKWVLPVEECKDTDTDKTEYFVSFPDDLLEAANLKEGDQVEWIDQGDGSFKLVKKEVQASWVEGNKLSKTKTYDEMVADGWEMTDDGFWIRSEVLSSVIKSDEC